MNVLMKGITLVFSLLMLGLVGCGDSTFSSGEEPIPEDDSASVAASLIISTDATEVQSNGLDSASIRVLALDSANGAIAGAQIAFATTAGTLSASGAVTDAAGEAVITFSAGSDPTNQTATISATSGTAAPASIPVDIVGSTVAITATRSNLVIGGEDTAILTIKAVTSSDVAVYGTDVAISIDGSATTGSADLSIPTGGVTDPQGEWDVNLTGTSPGTVRVVATALGATTSYDFLVESVAGSLLITSPLTGATAPINTPTAVDISVPAGITDVTIVSAKGSWAGSGTAIRTWTGLVGPLTLSDNLTSTTVGTASIYVADENNSAVNDNIKLVFVDETVDSTSSIFLQAIPTTIAPSTNSSISSSVLEASVINGAGNPIANARVTLAISNDTGSGEYVDPPVIYTDAYGKANSNLYAGTESTDADGMTVTASLDETLTGLPVKSDSSSIIVNGTVGSISIGISSKLSSAYNDTAYSRPITVQVADGGGGAIADVAVNISIWPVKYGLGYWACNPDAGLVLDSSQPNEDVNKNLILEAGEDVSGDGKLTPPISAAGTVPFVVTTDSNGVATFDHTYLKDNAGFIEAILTAQTLVQGTEAIATSRFWLEATESDVTACDLGPGSPFNLSWPILTVSSDTDVVATNSGTTVRANLTNTDDPAVALVGKTINATILTAGTDDGTTAPTITTGQVTDGNGDVSFTYTSGGKAGGDLIKITYPTGTSVVIAQYVYITAL